VRRACCVQKCQADHSHSATCCSSYACPSCIQFMLEPAVCQHSASPVIIQYFRHAYETPTCLPTYFAVTLSYVHTDPDSLPSFADKCIGFIPLRKFMLEPAAPVHLLVRRITRARAQATCCHVDGQTCNTLLLWLVA